MSGNRSFASAICGHALVAVFFSAALLAAPQGAVAQGLGPFAPFAGDWQGTGRVVGTNGNSERIKCRATYTISPDGAGLVQSLVCASASFRFDIRSDVVSDGRTVHGTWEERTRDATGNLVGQIRNGAVETSVSGPGFSAQLSVKMSGGKQVVSITPQGTDIAKVDITMTH